MSKNVISINSDQTIHQALELMIKHDIHQLPVIERGSLKGMIQIKKIISKGFDEKTKINSIITKVPTVSAEDDVESAAEMFLKVGLRALPVMDKNKIVGIVSEVDFLNAIDKKIDIDQYVSECVLANTNDTVGKIKTIMFDHNISRVPLMDDKGNIQGIVDILDIAKIYGVPRNDEHHGKKLSWKKRTDIESVLASNALRQTIVMKKGSASGEVINNMKKFEEVVIVNGNCFIITPKDLLEVLVSKPKRGVYVQIIGLKEEDSDMVAKMDQAVEEFVQKMGKMIKNPEFLFIHIEHHQKQGTKIKYSMRARFKADIGFFIAKAWGWNPIEVAQEVMDKLESEVIRERGRIKDKKRR